VGGGTLQPPGGLTMIHCVRNTRLWY